MGEDDENNMGNISGYGKSKVYLISLGIEDIWVVSLCPRLGFLPVLAEMRNSLPD
jgi:hypothetical protein